MFDFEKYDDHIAPMPAYGGRHIFRMNGSGHDAYGFGSTKPSNAAKFVHHYVDKIEKNRDDIVMTESFNMDDAEYAIISFGCSVRPAMAAMRLARAKGMKVGVMKIMTIWPFAGKEVTGVLSKVKGAVVPEMNLGQLRSEIERYNDKKIPIIGVNRVDSEIITPYEIIEALEEAAK